MSDIGKVTIEAVTRPTGTVRHVRAAVSVGGSLVDLECDAAQDPELERLVEQLNSRLHTLALQAVQVSLGGHN